MTKLNYSEIEKKWQEYWEENKINKTDNDFSHNKKKFYILDMFPYPSGEGLHVGHPKGYIATDVYSRMKKMQGYNVLHPMGWDAFGLPAEQYAIANKVNPNVATEKNVKRYKEQIEMLGINYDWDREVNTTDPKYYKWTQWMFKQMYKDGLAHESFEPINWCPSCKTGLSNEDLDGNACERCGTIVEKKPLRQWVIKITNYADRLLNDLDKLNWEPHIKELQRNWIGKSEGSEIDFEIVDADKNNLRENKLKIFTTRGDTLFGCTFMCISYTLAKEWINNGWQASDEIKNFIKEIEAEEKSRTVDFDINKLEKKGIDTNIKAINPANGEEVPIYIANYILSDYGTGAIMAVPAHDERDFEFAKKYDLEIREVIAIPAKEIPKGDLKRRDATVSIVEDNNKFLVLSTKENKFLFPQGGIEENDINITESSKREIKEESGYIDVSLIRQVIVTENYFDMGDRGIRHRLSYVNHFKLNSEEKTTQKREEYLDEDFIINWFSKEEVLEKLNTRNHKEIFEFFIENKIYEDEGILVNSQDFSGMNSEEARVKITEKVGGKMVNKYKLKDWVFARQRYWGEPFPIVFDENRKSFAVADKELPVVLPNVENYEPTDNGESPLANIRDWVEVYGFINDEGEFESCDANDPKAKKFFRETNTMPQWAGSSWYYLRYIDPKNDNEFVNKSLEAKWDPVDFYVGGAEHATRHLIYARFWHKFLFDKGFVSYDEPFTKLQTVGLIMAEDGKKMSKRYGNVVNPDDVVKEFGADAMRTYEMFMGPFDKAIAWSTNSMAGVSRFLERVYNFSQNNFTENESKDIERIINQTIKKVGEDIQDFKFNTAISQLMICLNAFEDEIKKGGTVSKKTFESFVKLIATFAPYISEEIHQNVFGNNSSIHTVAWPEYDEEKIKLDEIEMSLQISGKFRGTFKIKAEANEEEIKKFVKDLEVYKKYVTDESQIKKIIVVQKRLINIVI